MADRYGEALSFLRECRDIPSLALLEGRYAALVAEFGFQRTTCVTVAEPGRPIRPRVLFGLGDLASRDRYISAERQRFDPTYQAVFSRTRAFTWTDVEPLASSAQARDLFATARHDGAEGLIVPVHGAYGEIQAVVMVGNRPDTSDQARAVLQACGAMFAVAGVHLLELEDDAATSTALTRRETQVLVWLSRGKTIPEIATILEISIGTIKTHLERARAKLGHQATVPTLLEAARRGWLIDPDDFD